MFWSGVYHCWIITDFDTPVLDKTVKILCFGQFRGATPLEEICENLVIMLSLLLLRVKTIQSLLLLRFWSGLYYCGLSQILIHWSLIKKL